MIVSKYTILLLNKQRLANLNHNLDLLNVDDLNSLKGGIMFRTDECTEGDSSGCTDSCGFFGTVWNCTDSYCTDDCLTEIPSTTTDIACQRLYKF